MFFGKLWPSDAPTGVWRKGDGCIISWEGAGRSISVGFFNANHLLFVHITVKIQEYGMMVGLGGEEGSCTIIKLF